MGEGGGGFSQNLRYFYEKSSDRQQNVPPNFTFGQREKIFGDTKRCRGLKEEAT